MDVSVYLYAITDPLAQAPGLEGLQSAPVRPLRTATLAALVSTIDRRAGIGSTADMWSHELVVEELMAENDVLPARFGTLLDDDDSARRLLAERETEFHAALDRVAGAYELSLRVMVPVPEERPSWEPGAGAAYLRAAKRRTQLADDVSRQVRRALGWLARASVIRSGRDAAHLLESAWLIDRERLSEFRERAARLNDEIDDAELVCTGPWPPYSFVGAEGPG